LIDLRYWMEMSIRIAMLLSNPFRPDPRVLKEACSLAQAGYDVTVICWDRQGEYAVQEHINGFEIRRVAVHSGYSAGSRQTLYLPRFWLRALQELRVLKPDLVHCHDLDTAPAGYWYARVHRIPWILDAHECYPEQVAPQVNLTIYNILLFLERQMVRRATHVITVGKLLAQRFRSMGGQVSVVGNYQLLSAFDTKHNISRGDLALHPDDFVIAYIGGFTLDRAILPLIEATEYVSNVTVLLLGSGPQQAAVEAVLPDYPKVRYLGQVPQEQVPDYTALADVNYYGLNMSHTNSQFSAPNALFNALAAGKPVLTTNVGEIAHIVREEQCGIIVQEPTPMLLSQAIVQLRDPVICESLAANARRAAQANYNWNVAEATLLNVYEQLTTDR
jgi:glycosyltransferase involved in cell wall biosynthesis